MSNVSYAPRTAAWRALGAQAGVLSDVTIEALFEADPGRFDAFSIGGPGLLLDFSRQRLDRRGVSSLLDLAVATRVAERIEQLFAGEPINNSEHRAALHVALRRPAALPLPVAGNDVMPLVETERAKMRSLVAELESGVLRGFTGEPITDVVNIGIGGSDLGVVMAAKALGEYRNPDLGIHFVSNIDGVQLSHVLERVAPATTLFVICSKSFTTLETLTNARVVRAWLLAHGGDAAVASQCVAVSTNKEAMDEFGIAAERRFAIWDWVGGRFSLWSAVGLALALAIGWRNFEEMLAGAHAMDEHFRHSPFERNLPVTLALIGIWNRNFLGAGSHAVLPYDDHLSRLPAFLQQLEMESNGKSVRRNGEPVECRTCPVVWGESGSNAQHSFYQLLHQGTDPISIDFLLPAASGVARQAQQDLAAANCLAQTLALAVGDREAAKDSPHRDYPGGRPSSLLLFERLDPGTLGSLIALYEHKTFVQGVIWDVNSFDQWGVELGKRLASGLTQTVSGGNRSDDPKPIAGALDRLRALRPR